MMLTARAGNDGALFELQLARESRAVKVKLRPRVTQHSGATKTAAEE